MNYYGNISHLGQDWKLEEKNTTNGGGEAFSEWYTISTHVNGAVAFVLLSQFINWISDDKSANHLKQHLKWQQANNYVLVWDKKEVACFLNISDHYFSKNNFRWSTMWAYIWDEQQVGLAYINGAISRRSPSIILFTFTHVLNTLAHWLGWALVILMQKLSVPKCENVLKNWKMS